MTLQFPTRAERTGRLPHIASLSPRMIERMAEIGCGLGSHLDPWLRTHERLGADIVAPVPIDIDRERDEGVYVESNVWTVHAPRPATEP